ncbi:MAG: hypothetical protein IKX51_00490 [Bacteroidales bacterium]|nr:hypothetical protein [Bacteroidales bacterium]
MEYIIAKKDLKNDLLVETLCALAKCYKQLPADVYVVGAVARDLAFQLLQVANASRRTMDLDVAVMLKEWGQYKRLSDILLDNGFVKAPEKQRFLYLGIDGQRQYVVDIVPFGSIAENGQVAWPPEGSPVMSIRCLEDVLRTADKVQVDNDFAFYIPSLSGQFLVKLDAWQDRGATTRKDAYDMVYILQNVYIAYALANNVLPDEVDIDAEHFDVVAAGAEWIAADLAQMLTTEDRIFYANILHAELDEEENSRLLNDMLDVSDNRNYLLYRRALSRMEEILRGKK